MIKSILLVGIGGGLGSIIRYLTSVIANKYFHSIFPLATFITNIMGCFIIGVLLGVFDRQSLTNPDLKALLIIGFCGGYTTFSAFAAENIKMLQSGYLFTALIYVTTSVLLGLLAVWLGLIVTKPSP